MKKMFTILLSVSTLLVASCSSDKSDVVNPEEKGNIALKSNFATIDIAKFPTRANPDLSTFILTLNNNVVAWPENDIIEDLDAGAYTVAIKSAATPPASGFEAPYYYGEKQVTVTDGQDATAEIIIDLKNASIKFDYTALTGTPYESLIPVVKQGTTTLKFENENRDKAGYFEVGTTQEIEISLQDAEGQTVLLGGKESQTLAWNKINYALTVELSLTAQGKGGIELEVDFAPIENDTITWRVGEDGGGEEPDEYTVLEGVAGALYVQGDERFKLQMAGTYGGAPFTFILEGYAPNEGELLVGEYTVDQEGYEDAEYYCLAEGDEDDEYIGSYIEFGEPYTWSGEVYYFEGGTVSITKDGDNYVITTKVSGSIEDQPSGDFEDFSGEAGMFKFTGPIEFSIL